MSLLGIVRFPHLAGVVFRSFKKFGTSPHWFCAKMSERLQEVSDVEIENDGVFKYILIKLYPANPDDSSGKSKLIVRGGNLYGPYHSDIYDATHAKVSKLGLDSECLGGGRIKHESSAKKLHVYGYSQGFGKADHQISVDLLKQKYSDYAITWSDEDNKSS